MTYLLFVKTSTLNYIQIKYAMFCMPFCMSIIKVLLQICSCMQADNLIQFLSFFYDYNYTFYYRNPFIKACRQHKFLSVNLQSHLIFFVCHFVFIASLFILSEQNIHHHH